MSAIIHCSPWNLDTGRPNWTLDLEYSMARSRAPWAQPDGLGGDDRAGGVQGLHGVDEPLALLADQVLGRNLHVLEDQLGGRETP